MPWQVRIREDRPVVELTYSGRLDIADLRESMVATLAALVRAATPQLLTDCRAMEGGHSMTDLYDLMEEAADHGMRGHVREALLLPPSPDSQERVRFWETVGLNNGMAVRAFEDRDSAMAWLAETGGATPPVARAANTGIRRKRRSAGPPHRGALRTARNRALARSPARSPAAREAPSPRATR